jgi:hypothetical protein
VRAIAPNLTEVVGETVGVDDTDLRSGERNRSRGGRCRGASTRWGALEGQPVSFGVARGAPQKSAVEQPNYRVEEDYQLAEEQPKKKRRRKHRQPEADVAPQ